MHILGLGGTLRLGSSTENALRYVLREAQSLGASTALFCGEMINLPMYVPHAMARCERTSALVEAMRRADAIVVGSPGYHGGISGLVKNALDYSKDLAKDRAPYFEGRAVGCIATGAGWQGASATLAALRNVVHALRGWPTPLGIALNTEQAVFDSSGNCVLASASESMRIMASELVDFATSRSRTSANA